MKYISILFSILILAFSLNSCQQGTANNNNEYDLSSIDGKKQAIESKREQIASLKDEIKKLEAEITKEDPSALKKEKVFNITVHQTEKRNYEEFIEASGNIETKGKFNATSQIPGTITYMPFEEGDAISKGSLVATIDNSTFQTNRDEIQVQLRLARDVYERRKRLWDQNIGSEIEYLNAQNNVESLEKRLASLNVQENKTKVYAPASGVVERVGLRQGELASPGMPIVNIISTSNVQVVADLVETYLPFVKKEIKYK